MAALVLSGCHWGEYTFYGDIPWNVDGNSVVLHQYLVVLHQQNTDDTIHACDNNPRDTDAHARCVLDVIRWVCNSDPIPGFSPADCNQATDHTGASCVTGPDSNGNYPAVDCTKSMRSAIRQVRNGSVEHLAYEHQLGGPSRQWIGW